MIHFSLKQNLFREITVSNASYPPLAPCKPMALTPERAAIAWPQGLDSESLITQNLAIHFSGPLLPSLSLLLFAVWFLSFRNTVPIRLEP